MLGQYQYANSLQNDVDFILLKLIRTDSIDPVLSEWIATGQISSSCDIIKKGHHSACDSSQLVFTFDKNILFSSSELVSLHLYSFFAETLFI